MKCNKIQQFLKLPILKTDGKKPPPLLVWGILAAIVFLAIGSFTDKKEPKKNEYIAKEFQQATDSQDEYMHQLELRLVSVLETIDGAGSVQVFLSIESGGSKILATDVKTESKESENDHQNEKQLEKEESVVFMEDNSGQSPYIIEERMPYPSGVLVVAEGARDEHVKMELYEAVKAVFGLSAHRIKVTY